MKNNDNDMVMCDCFAYSPKSENPEKVTVIGHCKILTELICKKKECPFYKTQKEYDRLRKIYG